MRSKQTALLKDLSRLLRKYNARDWQLFIRLLSIEPVLLNEVLATAKERARGGVSKPSIAKRSPKKGQLKRSTSRLSKGGSKKLKRTKRVRAKWTDHNDTAYRSALSKAPIGDLKSLYAQTYRDKKTPEGKAEIISKLEARLRKLPEKQRSVALNSLSNRKVDPGDTIRRWADIISKGGRDS